MRCTQLDSYKEYTPCIHIRNYSRLRNFLTFYRQAYTYVVIINNLEIFSRSISLAVINRKDANSKKRIKIKICKGTRFSCVLF